MGFTAAGASIIGGGLMGILGGAKRPVIPPSPVMPAEQVDESVQNVEQDAMRRQSIAGGINSTIGTSGGEAGQMLNPSTVGNKTLLGQ